MLAVWGTIRTVKTVVNKIMRYAYFLVLLLKRVKSPSLYFFTLYWSQPLLYSLLWIRLNIWFFISTFSAESVLYCILQHSLNHHWLIFIYVYYIIALLEVDVKYNKRQIHFFSLQHPSFVFCSIKSCYYPLFSTQEVWQHGGNWPYLWKKNPQKSSKNWKHLHKCCFHGHLSCFCLALNGKTMLGFWPEPKTKKVSKLFWLTSRQPGGLAELSRAAEGRGLKTLTHALVVWWRDLAFQQKRDGGLCSKPTYLRETFWCMMGGIK